MSGPYHDAMHDGVLLSKVWSLCCGCFEDSDVSVGIVPVIAPSGLQIVGEF